MVGGRVVEITSAGDWDKRHAEAKSARKAVRAVPIHHPTFCRYIAQTMQQFCWSRTDPGGLYCCVVRSLQDGRSPL